MKYAAEVIDLLAAYPEKRFRMRQIVNHVATRRDRRTRLAVRMGVWRVLQALEESGQIESSYGVAPKGAHVEYWWSKLTSSSGKSLRKTAQYVRATAS